MGQKTFEMRNAKTCTGGVRGGCTKPQRRASRYLTGPRAEKPLAYEGLYVAREKLIPTYLEGESPKSKARLASRAAIPGATRRALRGRGRVAAYVNLCT